MVGGGNEDVNGNGYGDGAGTRRGVEENEGTQGGNGNGSGDGAGTGTGVNTRGRTQDWNGDGSGDKNESSRGDGNRDGNEDRIGEGGREAKKRKKAHKSYRRDAGNGGDLGGKNKNVDKKGLVQ